ncbi:MAG: hypothetical protein HQL57_05195 [Magnetococcales bacterium]|nr:hypothetical protein [Magnetococcales bacterium]MBF0156560.1 hypothetical protein [Magnetococcales bacterium]
MDSGKGGKPSDDEVRRSRGKYLWGAFLALLAVFMYVSIFYKVSHFGP